jgi:hypothetical protein
MPQTEADLSGDSGLGYDGMKASAIARAKLDIYRSVTPPAEADTPDLVLFQIADIATVYLAQAAKDYYKTKARMSDAKDGATIAYYDRVDVLDSLIVELKTRVARNADAVAALVSGSKNESLEAAAGLPLVSGDGRKVTPDPTRVGRVNKGEELIYYRV